MFGSHRTDQPASLVQQTWFKIAEMQIRVHGQLGIEVLFAVNHSSDLYGVRDAEITFVPAIINDAVAAVDLRAGRNLENQDVFAFAGYGKRRQNKRGVKFLKT